MREWQTGVARGVYLKHGLIREIRFAIETKSAFSKAFVVMTEDNVPHALRPLVRDMPNHQCTRRHADDPTCDLEAVIHFEFGQAEESYPRTSGEGRAGHESGPPLLIVSADAWGAFGGMP